MLEIGIDSFGYSGPNFYKMGLAKIETYPGEWVGRVNCLIDLKLPNVAPWSAVNQPHSKILLKPVKVEVIGR